MTPHTAANNTVIFIEVLKMKNQIEKLQEKMDTLRAVYEHANRALLSASKVVLAHANGLKDAYSGKSEKAAIKRAVRVMERAAKIMRDEAEGGNDEN